MFERIFIYFCQKHSPWHAAYMAHKITYGKKAGSRRMADLNLAYKICLRGHPLFSALVYYYWRIFGLARWGK